MTTPVHAAGSCHCGAVRVSLTLSRPLAELGVRACQCSFCSRHGGLTMSDPAGSAEIVAAPGALRRYAFGRRQIEFLLCRECGVYVAAWMEAEGRGYSTLNAAGVDLPGVADITPQPMDYDEETDDERIARRLSRWTPTVLVEAVPNA